jgi:hypothetical protein
VYAGLAAIAMLEKILLITAIIIACLVAGAVVQENADVNVNGLEAHNGGFLLSVTILEVVVLTHVLLHGPIFC